MFDDNDRLQQMEDNFNGGDMFQALGRQQNIMRQGALLARQEACDHKYKDFRENTAVCLDCDLDVSNVPLNEAERESLR